ncbi:MAG: transcriptional regulator [Thermoplasmata archaeon]
MKEVPCERAVWEILPAIRRELSIILVKEHAISQRNTAKILGLTEAAVSQYINAKRGENLSFSSEIMREIKKSAGAILVNEERTAHELCRICTLVQHYIASEQCKIVMKRRREK